jgi:hypothetical protein
VNDELERKWNEAFVATSRYYVCIFLEVLRKTTKNLSQNNRSEDRDLNPISLEHEARMLPLDHIVALFFFP